MILYFLEPEVSGGHGEYTIYGTEDDIATEGISGKVKYLHYEFEGWLRDDFLESTPCNRQVVLNTFCSLSLNTFCVKNCFSIFNSITFPV
ncbi:hypothetical protein [Bacillus massilinigeriensis]|uniref:hypothetical protein n=1 Tax=Bacillus mediterraneensis TaxID=1805474 RepID=UPI00093D9A72|nr:hypothetical protein [Bacillus mediterraneensis]